MWLFIGARAMPAERESVVPEFHGLLQVAADQACRLISG